MKISREESIELLYGKFNINGREAKWITEYRHGARRWMESVTHIISYDGKFWAATCDEPLTENQEGGRWEYEDPVEWKEVFPKEKTITVYE